jgi:hypothetical protein
MRTLSRLAGAGALLFAWLGAEAQGTGLLRCGGRIIDEGAALSYVLALCGRPQSHLVREVPVRARRPDGFAYVAGTSVSEQLIYDRGWGQFPALLEFHDGYLRRIYHLPYRD